VAQRPSPSYAYKPSAETYSAPTPMANAAADWMDRAVSSFRAVTFSLEPSRKATSTTTVDIEPNLPLSLNACPTSQEEVRAALVPFATS
jgi:hypothetical protein